ncbi:MAG: deoxyuridine 5'-triphosphate nucleotidohydrolase, partial [Candidatus Micrarchaeota archaeon]
MIVPGHVLKEKGFVRGLVGDAQVQPCGIDLTLRDVYSLAGAGRIDFDNRGRKISGAKKLAFKYGWIGLKRGAYKIVY